MRLFVAAASLCAVAVGFLSTSTTTTSSRPTRLIVRDGNSEDLENIWRAHSKPLLRVGSNGVKDSHKRSLEELLDAHGYVSVKINGCPPDAIPLRAADLESERAQIVMTKGSTVLFAQKK